MRRRRVELGAVGVGEAEHVARVLDDGDLLVVVVVGASVVSMLDIERIINDIISIQQRRR